jgi:hypothetical protein
MTDESLADALPKEIERVQSLIPIYEEIPTGVFAATMMRQSIKAACNAMMSGDVVGMIRSYEDLKEYKP